MKGQRVLITGATSGLGREMAVQLAREGARLALTGRRLDKLEECAAAARAAGAEVLALPGDVSDHGVVKSQYAAIKKAWGGLDWAVLNAGVSESRGAHEFSAKNYRWTFDINVMGVAHWMEEVLPDMLAAKSGVIAGVSSLAGFRGLPLSGAYCASKAALITMLDSTRAELRGTGVDIVTICPGFVKSEITARYKDAKLPFELETDDGVRRMIAGIKARKRLVHFPWQLSIPVIYVLHNLPGWLYDRVAGKIARRKQPYPAE